MIGDGNNSNKMSNEGMTITKESLKKNFSKASRTYDDNATVQIYMGKKLLESVGSDKFEHILEIGCGSGLFSAEIINRYLPKTLALNDISEEMLKTCRDRFLNYKNIFYYPGDIEQIRLPEQYSLIISNACLQWLSDLKTALKGFINTLTSDGVLAFTSFGNENVKEITSLTQNGLKYLSNHELDVILRSLKVPYTLKEEIIKFHYKDALNMLRTLKRSGVTGFSKNIWTRGRINSFIDEYESRFSDENGVYLTWHLYYVIVRNH